MKLLKDTVLFLDEDKKQDLSLLIGRNNSGKTSFIMLFDKFYRDSYKFNFDDFSISLRDDIFKIDDATVIEDLSIQMILEIKYDEKDSLENLSDFILDLDPAMNV